MSPQNNFDNKQKMISLPLTLHSFPHQLVSLWEARLCKPSAVCVAGRGRPPRGRGGLSRGVQAADGAGAVLGKPGVDAKRVELVATCHAAHIVALLVRLETNRAPEAGTTPHSLLNNR